MTISFPRKTLHQWS